MSLGFTCAWIRHLPGKFEKVSGDFGPVSGFLRSDLVFSDKIMAADSVPNFKTQLKTISKGVYMTI